MNWPQSLGEWMLFVFGVWGVLFLTGLGMRSFDWLIEWSRRRK